MRLMVTIEVNNETCDYITPGKLYPVKSDRIIDEDGEALSAGQYHSLTLHTESEWLTIQRQDLHPCG